MKSKLRHFISGVLVAMLVGTAGVYVSAAGQPGSTDDPLVSKSYVDDQIEALTNLLNSLTNGSFPQQNQSTANTEDIVAEVIDQIDLLYGGRPASAAGATYTPVNANNNQLIIGQEGTEIILRSGTAQAFCPGSEGISDVTSGADIKANDALQANHLLIIPRDDGRGVLVTADNTWFLIKGGYTVQ